MIQKKKNKNKNKKKGLTITKGFDIERLLSKKKKAKYVKESDIGICCSYLSLFERIPQLQLNSQYSTAYDYAKLVYAKKFKRLPLKIKDFISKSIEQWNDKRLIKVLKLCHKYPSVLKVMRKHYHLFDNHLLGDKGWMLVDIFLTQYKEQLPYFKLMAKNIELPDDFIFDVLISNRLLPLNEFRENFSKIPEDQKEIREKILMINSVLTQFSKLRLREAFWIKWQHKVKKGIPVTNYRFNEILKIVKYNSNDNKQNFKNNFSKPTLGMMKVRSV